MKTLKCDLCDHEAQGESFEAWMNAMKSHYGEDHADFMKRQGQKSPAEQQASMKKWMEENKARFDAA
jgi:hypothetical protein